MKVISIRLPEWILDNIDKLVDKKIFISRSEFIRFATRLALKKYRRFLEENNNKPEETLKARLEVIESEQKMYSSRWRV